MLWHSFRKNQARRVGTILFPERYVLNFNTYGRKSPQKSASSEIDWDISTKFAPKNTGPLWTQDLTQTQPAVSKMKHALQAA